MTWAIGMSRYVRTRPIVAVDVSAIPTSVPSERFHFIRAAQYIGRYRCATSADAETLLEHALQRHRDFAELYRDKRLFVMRRTGCEQYGLIQLFEDHHRMESNGAVRRLLEADIRTIELTMYAPGLPLSTDYPRIRSIIDNLQRAAELENDAPWNNRPHLSPPSKIDNDFSAGVYDAAKNAGEPVLALAGDKAIRYVAKQAREYPSPLSGPPGSNLIIARDVTYDGDPRKQRPANPRVIARALELQNTE